MNPLGGKKLEDVDRRDTNLTAAELDRLALVEATKVSEGVKSLQKLGAPIYGLLVVVVGCAVYVTAFIQEWKQVRDVGSPAMVRMEANLRVEMAAIKKTQDDRYDLVAQVLAGQRTTNALLTQRIDQHEAELQRLRDRR